MLTKRGKARLILICSTNTNCENMAYRSFRFENDSARGVRKVTTGINLCPYETQGRRMLMPAAGLRTRQTHPKTPSIGISCLCPPRVHSSAAMDQNVARARCGRLSRDATGAHSPRRTRHCRGHYFVKVMPRPGSRQARKTLSH